MTNQEILDSAVALLCENETDGDVSDYERRAPYILANFCTQNASLDALYREAYGIGSELFTAPVYVELSDEFSLCEVFSAAAVHYLAALLVLDENASMSDKFFSLHAEALTNIRSTLPATIHSITDRYGLN